MEKSDFVKELGEDKFGKDIFEALEIARRILNETLPIPLPNISPENKQ